MASKQKICKNASFQKWTLNTARIHSQEIIHNMYSMSLLCIYKVLMGKRKVYIIVGSFIWFIILWYISIYASYWKPNRVIWWHYFLGHILCILNTFVIWYIHSYAEEISYSTWYSLSDILGSLIFLIRISNMAWHKRT